MHYLIVPGIDDSDADHWQSHWQSEWGTAATRIAPSSWTEPDLDDWLDALDRAVAAPETVAVAHSLGCLAVAEWLIRRRPGAANVIGVFLVAPPDSSGPNFPTAARSFTPTTTAPLKLPGVVVSSTDDPYCAPAATAALAAGWRLDHIVAGRLGHINSASGLGVWQYGRNLFTAFKAGLGHR
ncbi:MULTISPECIES: alpha/beta hydrolase [unclassified Nocardia]|uniref:RBBP9/YdeN family alpha/beta hydrolase n=1 Tax=unclassified Nocardia TaxID=2637762 RepID=UPI001CE4A22D|nr:MULTISPECIES: alpha/beta hydrolase [unclassified Nocardia]